MMLLSSLWTSMICYHNRDNTRWARWPELLTRVLIPNQDCGQRSPTLSRGINRRMNSVRQPYRAGFMLLLLLSNYTQSEISPLRLRASFYLGLRLHNFTILNISILRVRFLPTILSSFIVLMAGKTYFDLRPTTPRYYACSYTPTWPLW
jgi:hypothetical protein